MSDMLNLNTRYSGHIPKIAAENKFGGTYGMMCDGDDEVRIRQHRNDFPIFHYTQMPYLHKFQILAVLRRPQAQGWASGQHLHLLRLIPFHS